MVVDFFDSLYSKTYYASRFLEKTKLPSLFRLSIRILANFLIPISFWITNLFHTHKIISVPNTNGRQLIVSLTSFPARIDKVWIVVECLLRQTHKPDRIILWLAENQFPFKNLPKSLLNLQERGLEIRWCQEDLKSHKKYFFVMQEFPDAMIVTVDDDLFYSSFLLGKLLEFHSKYPDSIICHRALKIEHNQLTLNKYNTWSLIEKATAPSYGIFLTSGGGTLFPPDTLPEEAFNKPVFQQTCFYADDVWLNMMAHMKETTVAKTSYFSLYVPIFNRSTIKLSDQNLYNGLNDKQIEDTRAYYLSKYGRDPLAILTEI